MSSLKTSIILVWPGTNVAIPAGWERETVLDSKYPKGTANGVNPDVTGGNSTHSHSATANHGHTMVNHTHSIAITGISGSTSTAQDLRQACSDHTNHAGTPYTSGAAASGALTSVSASYDAVSNNPPYHEVIFINPTVNTNFIPDDVITLIDSADVPTGFTFCNGGGTTPDLRNKYLKGAGTGADAGGTGGSLTNTHILTHTHAVSDHTHLGVTTGAPNGYSQANQAGGGYLAHNHTHTITLNAVSPGALTAGNPSLVTGETVEPAYTKLIPIQNTSGGNKLAFKDMIGMFLGTLANIPSGWILCDGNDGTVDMRGRHLKGANLTSEAGDAGGSNTHIHASQTHTHTSVGTHTHTASGLNHTAESNRTGTDNTARGINNVHTYTVDSKTAVYNNGSTDANSQNNEPEYRTVAFIKLNKIGNASSFLMNFV